MKIAAFPKCYLEDITEGRMSLFEWIDMAKALEAEGLELYEGFLESHDETYLGEVAAAVAEAGFAMPMLCCSPDFTQSDPEARRTAVEREIAMIRAARILGGPGVVCRVLTGQRYPELELEQGLDWVEAALREVAVAAKDHEVVLGLENHYKDGYWRYPEFAQKQEVFLRVLDRIPPGEPIGVQYDPSNAIVAGDDPIELLRAVAHRVVSMHASDRYLVGNTTLEDLRSSDGTLGYSPDLRHGVTGRGLNDYPTIFEILAGVGYQGWVSIEDGMNGMGEMQESLSFLHQMRSRYFGAPGQHGAGS
ncbi:MAG: sugar phosphate isomerase/epimerase [Trueperaceae bacterium]|nr:MAG: sugar phosphate isomerase/epimerase [Trueperaceae bacterium]